MLRILNAIAIICLVAAAVIVYDVKYQATYEAQKVARLNNQIRIEREKIAALRAEWNILAAPARIQRLSSRYLGMKPVGVASLDDFSNLPERLTIIGDPIGDIINALPDHIGGRRDPIGKIIEKLDAANGPAVEATGSVSAGAQPVAPVLPDPGEAAASDDAEPGAVVVPDPDPDPDSEGKDN